MQAQPHSAPLSPPEQHRRQRRPDRLEAIGRQPFTNWTTGSTGCPVATVLSWNTTADGFAGAMAYANNFFQVNNDFYDLADSDMAVVLLARHFSTPFAFNDAMWEKYGASWADMARFNDPRTNQAPTANLYNAGPITGLGNRGLTLDGLVGRGMKIALCQVAARGFAGAAARAAGADTDEVFEEVMDNLLDGVQPVPAGIVAIGRAQERGFTFSFTA